MLLLRVLKRSLAASSRTGISKRAEGHTRTTFHDATVLLFSTILFSLLMRERGREKERERKRERERDRQRERERERERERKRER